MNLPEKAKQGEPCTQCGQCCASVVCGVGLAAQPEAEPPCPFLGYNQEYNKFGCMLIQIEQQTLPQEQWLFTRSLGIGKGCDSTFETES